MKVDPMQNLKKSRHLYEEERYHDALPSRSTPGLVWYIPEKKYFFDTLKKYVKNKKLLDIDCGCATSVSIGLSPLEYHYDYTGVDISVQSLKIAKKNLKKGRFIKANAEKLPLKLRRD